MILKESIEEILKNVEGFDRISFAMGVNFVVELLRTGILVGVSSEELAKFLDDLEKESLEIIHEEG